MSVAVIEKPPDWVVGRCTKYLARNYADVAPRHDYHPATSAFALSIAESWRFPLIEPHAADDHSSAGAFNEVTFVHYDPTRPPPARVQVLGTFGNLYEPLDLGPVADLPYFALTVLVPRSEVHTYRFLVDGALTLDPINPQQATLDNGVTWSRFFTDQCTVPLVFERWQWQIVDRLVQHILPFRSESARRFLDVYYDRRTDGDRVLPTAFRFDEVVGVGNFIDKLLAREEAHHRGDYDICTSIMDRLLRERNPYVEIADMPREMFVGLYEEMGRGADGEVPGWDYARYRRPRHFLELLRRHAVTGAFAQPRYGGNACAAGWAWLEDRYRDRQGTTLFDWRRHQGGPFGVSAAYFG